MNLVNNNKIHDDFDWRLVKDNPTGISIVEYRRKGKTEWKPKDLAPRGTTGEEMLEAGLLYRGQVLNGNVTQSGAYLFSDKKINGYYVQGYRSIDTSPATSSWWYTNNHPNFSPKI